MLERSARLSVFEFLRRGPTPHGSPLSGALLALWLLLLLCLMPALGFAATPVAAARFWPGSDYTRLSLESPEPIRYSVFLVKDPQRVVIDLENVQLTPALESLPSRLGEDRLIASVRVARNRPGTVRVVLELRAEVKPQAFALKPAGTYDHRLVIDLFPAPDALMGLVDGPVRGPSVDAATVAPVAVALPPTGREATSPEPRTAEPRTAEPRASEPKPQEAKASETEPTRHRPGPGVDLGRRVTVAVDAGHGGEDPGAKGRHGTQEKDVTLAVARKIKEYIDAEPGMRAVLTRDGDYFVPLGERVLKARRLHADLFVSIHADAFIRPDARGSAVYALSQRGATSAAARWLARKENESDLIGGVNLNVSDPHVKQVLLDLSQTATINDSIKLGRAVLGQLGELNTLHHDRVEQAGFAVLKAPDIPSILVETAFISNPEEEHRLTNDRYQEKLAEAVLSGIRRYFATNPPLARPKLAAADTIGSVNR